MRRYRLAIITGTLTMVLILFGCGFSQRSPRPEDEPVARPEKQPPVERPADTSPEGPPEQPPPGRPEPGDTGPPRTPMPPAPTAEPATAPEEPKRPKLAEPVPSVPFRPGERLTYSVSYTGISLAALKLRLNEGPLREEQPTYEINGTLKTHGVASWLVSIDDRLHSIVNRSPLFSWAFTHRENHNGDREVESSQFDRRRMMIVDHNNDTTALSEPVHDPVSAFYALRTLPLGTSNPFTQKVFLDGELYTVTITVRGRERISTHLGTIRAYRLHITTTHETLEKQMKKGHSGFYIWVSERRGIPVRIRVPATIGSIWAELVRIKR